MESENDKKWFFIRNHQQLGPVGFFELKKMFEHGTLTGDSFIWTTEMNGWQMAKKIDLLSDILESALNIPPQPNLAIDWSEQKKETYPNGRPLIRYLARLFDISLCSLLFITLVSILFPNFILDFSGISIFVLSLILWFLLEPAILTVFGNTIGKALLNSKLKTVNGEKLTFSTAFQRSIFVSAAGMGFGVPIIHFICSCFSYFDLKKNGISTWDRQVGTIVLYGQVSFARIIFAGILPLGLLIAGLVI